MTRCSAAFRNTSDFFDSRYTRSRTCSTMPLRMVQELARRQWGLDAHSLRGWRIDRIGVALCQASPGPLPWHATTSPCLASFPVHLIGTIERRNVLRRSVLPMPCHCLVSPRQAKPRQTRTGPVRPSTIGNPSAPCGVCSRCAPERSCTSAAPLLPCGAPYRTPGSSAYRSRTCVPAPCAPSCAP